jgi:hypothetical protein
MNQNSKTYEVNYIPNDIIDCNDKSSNLCWEKANSLLYFDNYWGSKPKQKTEFKALWSDTHLFLKYCVYDSSVYIDHNKDLIKGVNNSDRVEVFFRKNESLNPYYCLEIDPSPRVMVFKALPNKVFDFKWNWPLGGLVVKSSISSNKYVVEMAISIESLNKLNLISNNTIEVGLYRAKYIKEDNGVFEPKWISWINPNTENPNFHIHTSFGKLQLINK